MPNDDEPAGSKRRGGIVCQFQDALRRMDTNRNNTAVVRPIGPVVTRDDANLRVLNASQQDQMRTVAVGSGCPANMLYSIVQPSDRYELGDEAFGVHGWSLSHQGQRERAIGADGHPVTSELGRLAEASRAARRSDPAMAWRPVMASVDDLPEVLSRTAGRG
jgi:hypothetical protein